MAFCHNDGILRDDYTVYTIAYNMCAKEGQHFHTKYGIPLGPGEKLFLHFLSTKLKSSNEVISRSKHFCGRSDFKIICIAIASVRVKEGLSKIGITKERERERERVNTHCSDCTD